MREKSLDSKDQGLNFGPGGLRAPGLHDRSHLQSTLREQRELSFTLRRGVFAIKEGFLPVFDAVGKSWLREDGIQATLESHSAALQ